MGATAGRAAGAGAAVSGAPLRWGVVGSDAAAAGRLLAALAAAPDAAASALTAPDANALVPLARRYGVPTIYRDEASVMADDSVDAVVAWAGPPEPERTGARALAAGKHVLFGGPFTTEGLAAVRRAAAARPDLVARAVFPARWRGPHPELRDRVRAGELGRLVLARAQLAAPGGAGGAGLTVPAEPAHRRVQPLVDLLCHLAGSAPESVVAAASDPGGARVAVTLELDDGTLCGIDSLAGPDAPRRLDRLELHGTRGSVVVEGTLGAGDDGSAARILAGFARDVRSAGRGATHGLADAQAAAAASDAVAGALGTGARVEVVRGGWRP